MLSFNLKLCLQIPFFLIPLGAHPLFTYPCESFNELYLEFLSVPS